MYFDGYRRSLNVSTGTAVGSGRLVRSDGGARVLWVRCSLPDARARCSMSVYPGWLEFHSQKIHGPVVSIRSRCGIVRLEFGEGELADRVVVGIPDDDTWAHFSQTLDVSGFWSWAAETDHREPHEEADWYWWLEVRTDGREHRAAAWNGAPAAFDRVRDALLELADQVLVVHS